MIHRETTIQRAIMNYLALLEADGKVYAVRHNSISGPMKYGGYIKQSKKGVPDILCCINGKFVGFEVKSEVGKQSPEQKEAARAIEIAGGDYYLVRDVDEVRAALKNYETTKE